MLFTHTAVLRGGGRQARPGSVTPARPRTALERSATPQARAGAPAYRPRSQTPGPGGRPPSAGEHHVPQRAHPSQPGPARVDRRPGSANAVLIRPARAHSPRPQSGNSNGARARPTTGNPSAGRAGGGDALGATAHYRGFLDQRRDMIAQQVETAQQHAKEAREELRKERGYTAPRPASSAPAVGAAHAAVRNARDAAQRPDARSDARPKTPGLQCIRKDMRVLAEIPDVDAPLARQAPTVDYILGKQIGAGAYATVRFGMAKDNGRKVAVKLYDKYKLLDHQRRKSVWREIKIMERINHPNLVRYYDAIDAPKHVFIIMEYLGGGSLHAYLKKRSARRLDDARARRIFTQACAGLKYLHDRHIVHRDIKLENLLLDENATVKIIDFGFATIVPPGKKIRVFCGTPSYMAPEIVARKEHPGPCSDIWAMGVLLYALLCGSFPFKGQSDRELYRRIAKGAFVFPESFALSVESRALIQRVLTVDWQKRPLIAEVVVDPWVTAKKAEEPPPEQKPRQHSCSISSQTTAASARTDSKGSKAESAPEANCEPPSANLDLGDADELPAERAEGDLGEERAVQEASEDGGGSPEAKGQAWTAAAEDAPLLMPLPAATRCGLLEDEGRGVETPEVPTVPRLARPKELDERLPTKRPGTAPSSSPPSRKERNSRVSPEVEQEAIAKLQRLGYAPDEIRQQLQDEGSHLYKLYFRFLRALHAWDTPARG